MPMPRPALAVSSDEVEKPGAKIVSVSASSLGVASISNKPMVFARSAIRAKSKPRPSSLIVMIISFPC